VRDRAGEFEGRRVVVVGIGASGEAAARALVKLDAKVRVTEAAASPVIATRAERLRALGAEVEIGGHDLEALDAELAVVSPGIPLFAPVVTALMKSGVEVISEVELAYRLARCDFLAVTGTNGKTTTTSLLAAMLERSGVDSVAAGNIGLPLIDAISRVPDGGAVAVEVSSFQLATISSFRPRVAVLLNVAEDHTDWHGSFDAYLASKARIVEFQTTDDVFLPNARDEAALSIASLAPGRVVGFSAADVPPGGIGYAGGHLVWRDEPLLDAGDLALKGVAGLEDVAAAAGAALEYGVEREAVVAAATAFVPLHHRLDAVAEVDGVVYIDDSKATNPHATLAAVEGLENVVLIAGGRAKGIDLSVLGETAPPVRAVIALGEAADDVARAFEGRVEVTRVTDMDQAVAAARAQAIEGGSVLLSPGCASLDMYESYSERGKHFVRAVREQLGLPKGPPGERVDMNEETEGST
jgi:UDP-N-acetylmuramoylalanine--D-glutamate ligase